MKRKHLEDIGEEDEPVEGRDALVPKLDKEFVKRAKRRLRRNWQKGNFDKCQETLDEIDSSMVYAFRNQLTNILDLNPNDFTYTAKADEEILKIRHKVLDIFEQAPDEVALPILVSSLFIESEDVVARIMLYLHSKGKKPLSLLIQRLRSVYYTEDPAKKAGIKRLIRLLGELRDKRATSALFAVVKGDMLSMPANDSVSCTLFAGVGITVYFVMNSLPDFEVVFSWGAFLSAWAFYFIPIYLFKKYLSGWYRQKKEWLNNAEMVQEALNALALIPNKRNLADILRLRTLPNIERMPEYHALLASHFALLSPEDTEAFELLDRLWLVRSLERYSIEFTIAALKGLELVGREEALDRVRELTVNHVASAVKAEAKRVYPHIEERTEAHSARLELLRASHRPEETQTLLRPAQSKPDLEEEQQLLRPIE
ncbi:MAG: hypothetical protein NT023_01455 [Armatimonadetes bacterium]|nr:hypothetical protein [Armatimonadota bacterium]